MKPNVNDLLQEDNNAYVDACYCVRECDYNPPSVLAIEPGKLYAQDPVLITNKNGTLYAGGLSGGVANDADGLDVRALIWSRTAKETKALEAKYRNIWYPPNILFIYGPGNETLVSSELCSLYFKDAWSSKKFGKPDPSSRCSTKTTFHVRSAF